MQLDTALPLLALLLRELHGSAATHRDGAQGVERMEARAMRGVARMAKIHLARRTVVAVAFDDFLVA